MPQPPLGLVNRLSKKRGRGSPRANEGLGGGSGGGAGGGAPRAPAASCSSHAHAPPPPGVPEIVVDRAAIQPPSHRVSEDFDGRVPAEIITIQNEFAKAESRDTYETASAAIGRMLRDRGDDEAVILECLEQMKLASTPWGLRFCGWVMQVMAEECPAGVTAQLSVLASQSIPALLSTAKREDDLVYLLSSIGKLLRAVEHHFLTSGVWAADALYPRYFYYLVAPLLPVVASHGVAQLWSSEALATVLQSSESMLLGSPGSLSGPCNGEMDEVLHPVFDTVMTLVLALKGRVHPASYCAVLCLADTVLDVCLMLCTFHAPLYSMEELLKVPQRKLFATCLELTHFGEPWKLRLAALNLIRTLTKGGLGSKWRFKDDAYAAVLTTKIVELSKTDKVAEIRALAKAVLKDLAPSGRFDGNVSAVGGSLAGRDGDVDTLDAPSLSPRATRPTTPTLAQRSSMSAGGEGLDAGRGSGSGTALGRRMREEDYAVPPGFVEDGPAPTAMVRGDPASGVGAGASLPACPSCGHSRHVIPVVFGRPSPTTEARARRGEIKLSGCGVPQGAAELASGRGNAVYCTGCLREFEADPVSSASPARGDDDDAAEGGAVPCTACARVPQNASDRFCPYCGAPRGGAVVRARAEEPAAAAATSPQVAAGAPPQSPPTTVIHMEPRPDTAGMQASFTHCLTEGSVSASVNLGSSTATSGSVAYAAVPIAIHEVAAGDGDGDAPDDAPAPTPLGTHPATQTPIERLLVLLGNPAALAEDPGAPALVSELIAKVPRAADLERLVLGIARRVGWQHPDVQPHLLAAMFQATKARFEITSAPLALTPTQNQCLLQVLMTAQTTPAFQHDAAEVMNRLDFSVSL